MYWISSIGSVIYVAKPSMAKISWCGTSKGVVGLKLLSVVSSYVSVCLLKSLSLLIGGDIRYCIPVKSQLVANVLFGKTGHFRHSRRIFLDYT